MTTKKTATTKQAAARKSSKAVTADTDSDGTQPDCMEDGCDLPQYAEGRCSMHFKTLDRPQNNAPNVKVLDTPGEVAPSESESDPVVA